MFQHVRCDNDLKLVFVFEGERPGWIIEIEAIDALAQRRKTPNQLVIDFNGSNAAIVDVPQGPRNRARSGADFEYALSRADHPHHSRRGRIIGYIEQIMVFVAHDQPRAVFCQNTPTPSISERSAEIFRAAKKSPTAFLQFGTM